jgi:exoribonuclease R
MEAIINIGNRNYDSWTFTHPDTQEVLDLSTTCTPVDAKVFDGDKVLVSENTVNVLESTVKSDTVLTGILVLSDGKTYGRTENKKRLLYKCIPFNKKYPAFLIPYDLKLGLSKHILNKYVVFTYVHWNDKHPLGLLTQVLGNVDDDVAYGEYLLYSYGYHEQPKELINAVKDVDEASTLVEILAKNPQTIDRRNEYIFSIDGANTTDYDDALSITELNPGEIRISVYTTNLCRWIEHLDLWDHIENLKQSRTIYLPHRKKSMLCDKLVDMCVLTEKKERLSFNIDYIFKDGICIDTTFCETLIVVKKNHVYESDKLMGNSHYQKLYEYTKQLDPTITDSRDLVAYWMIRINSDAGAYLYRNKCGIFVKTTSKSNGQVPSPHSDRQLYAIINQVKTEYVEYSEDDPMFHEMLQTYTYAQISSEMRRVEDVCNKLELNRLKRLRLNKEKNECEV